MEPSFESLSEASLTGGCHLSGLCLDASKVEAPAASPDRQPLALLDSSLWVKPTKRLEQCLARGQAH